MSIRLAGKTVSFTGGFEALSRDQAIKAIKSCGATFQKQVNKNVDALVTGETKVGIRKLQAENLGIQIIPADRFQQYIRNKEASKKSASVRVKPVSRPRLEASSASRYVREEINDAPRMPWEEELVPRFGKIPQAPRRGRPAASASVPRAAKKTNATPAASASKKTKINAKCVVFAGQFNFPVSQLCKVAEDSGASIATTMRNADLVVFGAGTAAMVAKSRAREKGIQSMSELEFLRQ